MDESLTNEMVLPRLPLLFLFYLYGSLVLKLNDVSEKQGRTYKASCLFSRR